MVIKDMIEAGLRGVRTELNNNISSILQLLEAMRRSINDTMCATTYDRHVMIVIRNEGLKLIIITYKLNESTMTSSCRQLQ